MRSLAIDKSLEGIAGLPLSVRGTPGINNVSIPPFSGRIIYLVFDVLNTSTGWSSLCGTGNTNSGGILILNSNVNEPDITVRFDTNSGSTNYSLKTPVRYIGRHIVWGMVNTGITSRFIGGDSPSAQSAVITPGNGILAANHELNGPTSASIPLFTILYNSEHDFITRARVIQWLRSRYGIS